jgi:hypothetical protein
MALSNADKSNLRYWLGYSARFYQTDSNLEQAMNAVGSDDTVVGLLQSLVTRCVAIDAKLVDAEGRQRYEAADQEAIVYRGYAELAALRSQGRMTVGRMAALLAVTPRHDAFAPCVSNDAPNLSPFASSGGGNLMKLG